MSAPQTMEERFMAEVAAGLGRRARRPPFEVTMASKIYFVVPAYQAANPAAAGGCASTVTLGPGAANSTSGSATAGTSIPQALDDIRAAYPAKAFVAGHLINADLGGSGVVATNLTALTSAANSAHKNFDNQIKYALNALRQTYQYLFDRGVDITPLTFGIHVSVETSGDYWGDDYPDSCITTQLNCEADLVNVLDLDELVDNAEHRRTAQQLVDQVTAYVDAANQTDTVPNA
ncbi:hypothetical protein [Krasilnikovia sp. MM14-A1259]|uniref:hypothetical protein n=1 Tax=Krasilnikovia sp. MM14-A1259 TaxID=3373539 RepID=UPI00381176FB